MKTVPRYQSLYTTGEAAKILGTTPRKVMTFVTAKYLEPSKKAGTGMGATHFWSFVDLVIMQVILDLMESLLVEGETVRRFVRTLAADPMLDESAVSANVNKARTKRYKSVRPSAYVGIDAGPAVARVRRYVSVWESRKTSKAA